MIFVKPKSPLLTNSILKKMRDKSKRQTGWKALKSRPVMSIEAQEEMQGTKNLARLAQKSTSIVLTNLGIRDKKRRARLQWAIQQSYNDNATREQSQKARQILTEEFGSPKKIFDFTEEVLRVYNLNMETIMQQEKQRRKILPQTKK